MNRGKIVEPAESRFVEEVVRWDAGVVNASNIDEVKDWTCQDSSTFAKSCLTYLSRRS